MAMGAPLLLELEGQQHRDKQGRNPIFELQSRLHLNEVQNSTLVPAQSLPVTFEFRKTSLETKDERTKSEINEHVKEKRVIECKFIA